MRVIGIRELRQQASKYLRDVERGEQIEITDRGRPIARLVPIGRETALERLVASGRAAVATGDLLELGPPLKPKRDAATPSDELARRRADER